MNINRIIEDENTSEFNFYANLCVVKVYRKDFLAPIVLRFLQFPELLHESFGSDCCVDFGDDRKLGFAAAAGCNCDAAMRTTKRIKSLHMTTRATTTTAKEIKVINDYCEPLHARKLIKINDNRCVAQFTKQSTEMKKCQSVAE